MALTNKQLMRSGTGATGGLIIPEIPKLTLPDKVMRAFPDFQASVDRHHREMEAWRLKAIEGIKAAQ